MITKITAIVKMKPDFIPPQQMIRFRIADQMWTVEGSRDDLTRLSKSSEVESLSFSRPLPSFYEHPQITDDQKKYLAGLTKQPHDRNTMLRGPKRPK